MIHTMSSSPNPTSSANGSGSGNHHAAAAAAVASQAQRPQTTNLRYYLRGSNTGNPSDFDSNTNEVDTNKEKLDFNLNPTFNVAIQAPAASESGLGCPPTSIMTKSGDNCLIIPADAANPAIRAQLMSMHQAVTQIYTGLACTMSGMALAVGSSYLPDASPGHSLALRTLSRGPIRGIGVVAD